MNSTKEKFCRHLVALLACFHLKRWLNYSSQSHTYFVVLIAGEANDHFWKQNTRNDKPQVDLIENYTKVTNYWSN